MLETDVDELLLVPVVELLDEEDVEMLLLDEEDENDCELVELLLVLIELLELLLVDDLLD